MGNIDTTAYRHGTGSDITAVFDYDDLHRLTDFDLATGEDQTYTYDRSGNFKTMVTDASTLTYNYSAGATPNRLDSTTGTGGASYTYDDNGRVSTYAGNTLTYDYRSLTVTFNDGTADHTYLIDPDGKRVKKVSGGATTYYIRGADGSVLAEYDGTGSLTSTYIYTGTQRLAKIDDDTTQYYIQDHLGNTRALMADNGTVVSTMDYWPYGVMLSQTGSGDTRFKYTGHERDDESALDYMLARMYEHGTGRFMQMDPMADKYPGISPYVYTAGNPLKFIDPDGRVIRLGGINKGLMAKGDIVDFIGKGNKNLLTYTSAKDAGGNPIIILGINQGAIDAGGQFDFSTDGVREFVDMVADQGAVYQYNVDTQVQYKDPKGNATPPFTPGSGMSGGEKDRIINILNGRPQPSAQPLDPNVDAERTFLPSKQFIDVSTQTKAPRWRALRHELREMRNMVKKGTSYKAAVSGNAATPYYTRTEAHQEAGDTNVQGN